MRARAATTLACALALLAVAAPAASASFLNSFDGEVEYNAALGEDNDLQIFQSDTHIVFTDTVAITPSPPCVSFAVTSAGCPIAGVGSIEADLRDLDDRATIGDSLTLSGFGGISVSAGSGADTVVAGAGTGAEISGDQGADSLTGDSGSDRILGGDDSDSLRGGAGRDDLDGGSGNDVAFGGAGDDFFRSTSFTDGADIYDGGPDRDGIDFQQRAPDLSLDPDGVADDGALCPGPACEGDNIRPNVEDLSGGDGDDRIVGSSAENSLRGNAGDDTLIGGNRDDSLNGSTGDDAMRGDAGDDRLSGDAGGDTLRGGAGDDELREDLLDRATDVLAGGRGIDTGGYGFVEFALRIDLDGRPDDGTGSPLIGGGKDNFRPDIENVAGGMLRDVIIGNGGSNLLEGGDGDDRLLGRGGPDGLLGGDGADSLGGGKGRDSLEGASGADRVGSRDGGPDQVSCGSGLDRVKADRADQTGADCDRVARR
ncbi:MAG: calcium-binding protein [Solirubrobacterales bacterium]